MQDDCRRLPFLLFGALAPSCRRHKSPGDDSAVCLTSFSHIAPPAAGTTEYRPDIVRSDAAIPGGPIHRVDEMFASEHALARNLRVALPASGANGGVQVQVVANPMRLRESPITYEKGVPELGQHTQSVLADVLGLSAPVIANLRVAGVIQG